MSNFFLNKVYMGSDGDDFKKDFVEYLQEIIKNNRWDAMSDHTLYLQGAKKAIEEIIHEIKEADDERRTPL